MPQSGKKRILILADYFLPGYRAGGPVRTLANMIELLKSEYDIYLFTRNHDLNVAEPYDLPANKWIQQFGYHIFYSSGQQLRDGIALSVIIHLQPDWIYLNSFFSPWFSVRVIYKVRRIGTKVLLAPRGEFASAALANKSWLKRIFLLLARSSNLYKNVCFHASSQLEAEQIRAWFPTNPIKQAQDVVQFEAKQRAPKTKATNKYLKLCFISRVHPIKNLLFALEVVHRLIQQGYPIHFDIFGPLEDQGYWGKCKRYLSLSHGKIKYCGEIDHLLVSSTFAQYDYFLFPTQGENFGHAVFESLAVGTPVILPPTTFWNQYKSFGKWGYMYENNNPTSLEGCLKEAFGLSADDYENMSRQGIDLATLVSNKDRILNENKILFQ